MIYLRKATTADIVAIMPIIAQAREFWANQAAINGKQSTPHKVILKIFFIKL